MKLTLEERKSIREYLVGLAEDWATGHEDYMNDRTALTILSDCGEGKVQNSALLYGDPNMVALSIVQAMQGDARLAKALMVAVITYARIHTNAPVEEIIRSITPN
jgi:hypothetical protein